jgi:aspartyl-tRNA synthetase
MSGEESIRDYIAFPKNNSGRDTMIDAPSALEPAQLNEFGIKINNA